MQPAARIKRRQFKSVVRRDLIGSRRILKNVLMKFLLAWISVACSQQCSANTLIRFDNPYLLVELVGEKINGYYGLSSPEIDGRPSTSCEFFFTSDGAQTTKHDVVAIHTFYTNRTFNERDRGNLLAGEILRGRKEWTLQMAQVPFGCLRRRLSGIEPDHKSDANDRALCG